MIASYWARITLASEVWAPTNQSLEQWEDFNLSASIVFALLNLESGTAPSNLLQSVVTHARILAQILLTTSVANTHMSEHRQHILLDDKQIQLQVHRRLNAKIPLRLFYTNSCLKSFQNGIMYIYVQALNQFNLFFNKQNTSPFTAWLYLELLSVDTVIFTC